LKPVALVAAVLCAGALLLALSGPGDDAGAEDRATTAAKQRTKVKLIETRFGQILADGNGFALYLFTRDQDAAAPNGEENSRCYGRCADAWPVLGKRGKLRAGQGVSRGLRAGAGAVPGRSGVRRPLVRRQRGRRTGSLTETLATCANRGFRGGRSAPIYFVFVVVEKPGGLIHRQVGAELRDEAAGESASPVTLKRRVPTS
jgi:predicted lipoprotein with Yx(FWY)xxD motif